MMATSQEETRDNSFYDGSGCQGRCLLVVLDMTDWSTGKQSRS